MSYDPISPPTRRSRSALLVFSTSAIAVSAFGVEVSHVDGLIVEIDFPQKAVEWLLGLAAMYFACTFGLSVWDDVRMDEGRTAGIGATRQELQLLKGLVEALRTLPEMISSGPSAGSDYREFFANMEATNKLIERFYRSAKWVGDRPRSLEQISLMLSEMKPGSTHTFNEVAGGWASVPRLQLQLLEATLVRFVNRLQSDRNAAVWTFRLIAVELSVPLLAFGLAMWSWMDSTPNDLLTQWLSNDGASVQIPYIKSITSLTID